MNSFVIINVNCIFCSHLSMLHIKEDLIQEEFIFQYTINSFCHSIFIAMILFCHANLKAILFEFFHILITTVLNSSVRMMYYVGNWLGVPQGSFEGP